MKMFLAGCTLAGLLVLAPLPAAAQMQERGITVNGSSTLSVTPDTARLSFGVVTVAPSLEAARSRNASAMQKVMGALRGLNLPESTTRTKSDGTLETTSGLALRTGDMTVELIYADRRTQLDPPAIIGYRVTNSSVARYNDTNPEKLAGTISRIMDLVLANGANQVNQVEFSLRDAGETEQRAMIAALANAKLKAETLAREAGVRIRGVRSINQTSYAFQPRVFLGNQQGAFGGGGEGDATPLVAGTLLINGNVSVSYDISGQ